MATFKVFVGLKKSEVKRIFDQGMIHPIQEKSVLFKKGDIGSEMYIVLTGRIGIYGKPPSEEPDIAELGPGGIFGEMAMFEKSHERSATAIAMEFSQLLVLSEEAQEPPRRDKTWTSVLIMAAVLIPVILGWLEIAIAAVGGVVLMVVTGCITIQEAHRSIQWKAIFLIAGMLPLGIALQKTGAANFLSTEMVNLIGGWGPTVVMAGLFILAALASQVMPNPAVAVLLAPIALNTANDLQVSPYPLLMAVAVSASAAFLSPVGHSANIMVMGPGGYRFSDYLKVGLPLTVVVLLVVIVAVPFFWPF